MARIFISHSSADDAEAIALRRWIIDNGWDEAPFLDLDAQGGITAGERWERALHQAVDRCEAVLFVISRAWLGSDWCLREYNLARKLNKRLFGVLVEDIPLADLPVTLTGTWQVVNLAAGNDHVSPIRTDLPDLSRERHVTFSRNGLERLRAGLDNAGLDPSFFAWPPANEPERSPYPGLRPLEAADAGIFFGRDAPLLVALDQLRGMGDSGSGGLFVIQGASGAGKSSFLRAGLWPRLQRDGLHFLPLPAVRPRSATIGGDTGWVRCLQDALKAAGLAVNRAAIVAAVESGAMAVAALLGQIVEKVRLPPDLGGPAKPPTLVLAIDQAEELFLAEGAREASAFLHQLAALVAGGAGGAPSLIAVFTIRSNAYEKLQTAPELAGLRQAPFPLPPMPRGAYRSIIVEPALRLARSERKFKVEPALVDALLTDIERDGAKDSLPLLAFTLASLYQEVGGQGDLTLAAYESIGRLSGAIEAAVASALRAADADGTIPRGHDERMALLHRALVPALARIDPDTGQPQRLVAPFSDIPAEAQALVRCLVDSHLLVTDYSPTLDTETIEPAHETLLRQWKALSQWLQDDSQALRTLDGVQGAAAEWDHNNRTEKWLAHETGRLEDAEALQRNERFAASYRLVDRAYLDACRARENQQANEALAAKQREVDTQRRHARITSVVAMVAGVAAVVAIVTALWGWREAGNAERQATAARMKTLALQARRALAEADNSGNIELAAALALESVHAARTLGLAPEADAIEAAGNALNQLPLDSRPTHPSLEALVELADGRLASTHSNGSIMIWPSDGRGDPVTLRQRTRSPVAALPDGRLAIVEEATGRIRLWRATGAGPGEETFLQHGSVAVTALAVLNDGRLASADGDGQIKVWAATGGADQTLSHDGAVYFLAGLSDGRLLSASLGVVTLWPKDGSGTRPTLRYPGMPLRFFVELDGGLLAGGNEDGEMWIWQKDRPDSPAALERHGNLAALARVADGRLASAAKWGEIKVWPGATGGEPVILRHGNQLQLLLVLKDGRLVSGGRDGRLKFWPGSVISDPVTLPGHRGRQQVLAILKDGRLVGAAFAALQVWPKDGSGKPAKLDVNAARAAASPSERFLEVLSLVALPDGRLASGMDNGEILLWSLAAGPPAEQPTVLRHGTSEVSALAVLPEPDGRLVSGDRDGRIKLWPKEHQREPALLQESGSAVLSLVVLTDGRLASATGGATINIRRIGSAGEASQNLVFQNDSGLTALAAMPDGRVAFADDRGEVRIWDGAADEPKVRKHGDVVRSLVVLRDGRLASGGQDGSIKIWPKDGTAEPVILRHGAPVESLAVLDDGRMASAGGGDNPDIKLWLVDDDKMVAALCARPGLNLGEKEWDLFIGTTTRRQAHCRNLPSRWQ